MPPQCFRPTQDSILPQEIYQAMMVLHQPLPHRLQLHYILQERIHMIIQVPQVQPQVVFQVYLDDKTNHECHKTVNKV